ncbi:hypothetical protein QO259_17340 [Salinicola sp. JS01]|uniref:hypothetical protein n=1 Tax=Salinicola sp. JS01 TaxID=3050071 RepID=UPI00255B8163|nr:hypothetical protein [Salinicola sp. JS01]WIX32553.1 hypothetical protein QO259_17340 [Salinicola sp. JS01]
MNREVQRNAPGGGRLWLSAGAWKLGGQQPVPHLHQQPASKTRTTTGDLSSQERQRAAAEKRARRQAKRARDARRQQEGQQQ